MPLDEKRQLVARRTAKARVYDAENCTSVEGEFFDLLFHGAQAVREASEEFCDEWLSRHDEEGQLIDQEEAE